MGDPNCPFSLSNLNEEAKKEDHEVFMTLEAEDDEYIEALFSRESSFGSRAIHGFSENDSFLRCARSDSIQWVLKMKACFGFGYQTAYLAMTYFDRFWVRQRIDEGKTWALRLLSVACISLAAKMEEDRPPALSEYQLEEYQFSSIVIQRMELLILDTLEWRMSSVTPFAYLSYFASKLECKILGEDLISKVVGLIFAIIEARLVDHRPSTIAAAAILAVSSDRLTKSSLESKLATISVPDSLQAEHVFSCYSMMIQESQKEKLKPPKLLVSSVRTDYASVSTFIDVNNSTVSPMYKQ